MRAGDYLRAQEAAGSQAEGGADIRKLIRLALLAALAVWAWRRFVGSSGSVERAGISYADGSAVVFEPGSAGFDRLATIARTALRQ